MRYRERRKWKYTTEDKETEFIGKEFPNIEFEFLAIKDGLLIIKPKYAWDGASGPTIDTKNTMYPSLIHDALYQLMREGILSVGHKETADRIFYNLLQEREMWFLRARVWYRAVLNYGPTKSYVKTAP